MQIASSKTSTPILQSPQIDTPKPIVDKTPRIQQCPIGPPVAVVVAAPEIVHDEPVAPEAVQQRTETSEYIVSGTSAEVPDVTVETTTIITTVIETASDDAAPSDVADEIPEIHTQKTETNEINTEVRSATPASDRDENITEAGDDRPAIENNEMTASMIQRRIITADEAKAALAERRRIAREEAERAAELERQRVEAEHQAELKRQAEEEEHQRQLEEETLRLVEEQRKAEEQRLLQAIEVSNRAQSSCPFVGNIHHYIPLYDHLGSKAT